MAQTFKEFSKSVTNELQNASPNAQQSFSDFSKSVISRLQADTPKDWQKTPDYVLKQAAQAEEKRRLQRPVFTNTKNQNGVLPTIDYSNPLKQIDDINAANPIPTKRVGYSRDPISEAIDEQQLPSQNAFKNSIRGRYADVDETAPYRSEKYANGDVTQANFQSTLASTAAALQDEIDTYLYDRSNKQPTGNAVKSSDAFSADGLSTVDLQQQFSGKDGTSTNEDAPADKVEYTDSYANRQRHADFISATDGLEAKIGELKDALSVYNFSDDYRERIGAYIDSLQQTLDNARAVAAQKEEHYNFDTEQEYNTAVEISKVRDMSADELDEYIANKSEQVSQLEQDAGVYQKQIANAQKHTGASWESAKAQAEKNYSDAMLKIQLSNASMQEAKYEQQVREAEPIVQKYENEYANLTDEQQDAIQKRAEAEKDFIPVEFFLKGANTAAGLLGRYGTKREKDTYKYLLFNKYEESDTYLEAVTAKYQKKYYEESTADIKRLSEGHPLAMSIASVVNKPIASAIGLGDMVANPDTTYSYGKTKLSNIDDIRANISENIGNETGAFLYQTGMSLADFVFTTAVTGGFEPASLGLMGVNAASSATLDALKRGADNNQALMFGLLSGAAEVVFEKIPLDRLKGLFNGDISIVSFKDFAKSVLQQSLTEATEETLTEITNTLSDMVVNGSLSNYNQSVTNALANGQSYAQAIQTASGDIAKAVVNAGLGGALSGAATGGVMSGINYASNGDVRAELQRQNRVEEYQNADSQIDNPTVEKQTAPQLADIQTEQAQNDVLNASANTLTAENKMSKNGIYGENTAIQNVADVQAQTQQTEVPVTETVNTAPAQSDVQLSSVVLPTASAIKAYSTKQTEEISAALSRKVELYHGGEGTANGFVENGKVYVNADSGKVFSTVIGHEITHTVESAQHYDSMKKAVINSAVYQQQLRTAKAFDGDTGITHAENVRRYMKAYEQAGKTLNYEQAEQEVIADFIGNNLCQSEEALVELARTDRNMFQRLWDKVKQLVYRMTKRGVNDAELSRISSLFQKANRESANTGNSGNTQYSQSTEVVQHSVDVSEEETADDPSDKLDSEYLRKTVKDPTVREGVTSYILEHADEHIMTHKTDAQIDAGADEIVAEMQSNPAKFAEMLRDATDPTSAPTAEQMRALQKIERLMTNTNDAGEMTFFAAMRASELGRGLGSIRHGKTVNIEVDSQTAESDGTQSVGSDIGDGSNGYAGEAGTGTGTGTGNGTETGAVTSTKTTTKQVERLSHINDVQACINQAIDQKLNVHKNKYGATYDVATELVSERIKAEGDSLKTGGYVHMQQVILDVLDTVPEKQYNPKSKPGMVNKLKSAIKNQQTAKMIYMELQDGVKPMDAFRDGIDSSLHIKSLRSADYKTMLGFERKLTVLQDALNNTSMSDAEAYATNLVAYSDELERLHAFVAAKLSMSVADKLESWRKFAMLSNAKTHIRNIVSNTAQMGIKKFDDAIANATERLVYGITGNSAVLTRNVAWSHTEFGKSIQQRVQMETLQASAAMSSMLGRDVDAGDVSGAFSPQHARMMRETFKHLGGINKLSKLNSELLEREDAMFFRPAFASELGQRMTAAKVTEPTQEMLKSSTESALYSVFRNDNVIASFFAKMKQNCTNAESASGKAARMFLDVVLPFTKTPSNILLNTIDHSPIGFLKTAVDIAVDARQSHSLTTSEIISKFSKNATGTTAAILGYLLAKSGILKVFDDDDKDMARLSGSNGTSLVFKDPNGNDIYVSIDWLQPLSTTLFMGGVIGEMQKDTDTGLLDMFANILALSFEQSYLQSVQNTFSQSSYSDESYPQQVLRSTAMSYLQQNIPSVVGQLARSVDMNQRKVGGDPVNAVLSRTPFASQTLDSFKTVWGDDAARNNTQMDALGAAINAFNQFFNPSTISGAAYPNDETSKELIALWKRLDKLRVSSTGADRENAKTSRGQVMPNNELGDWELPDGTTLKEQQNKELYDYVASLLGKTEKRFADGLTSSDKWKSSTDSEKAKALDDIYKSVSAVFKDTVQSQPVETAKSDLQQYNSTVTNSIDQLLSDVSRYNIKLADGTRLGENKELLKAYDSEVEHQYQIRIAQAKQKPYSLSLDGKKISFTWASATDEQKKLAEDRERRLAESDVKKMMSNTDTDELLKIISSTGNHYEQAKKIWTDE